ncbi:Hypothetical predicted protein [Pelobates cultripes]|uniref:Uncharacterized protein n=1 Tax=Pelobates cultripes TaxID=61616 RepID=A0AAD1TCE1_PELCU|nr:Hypothetical predicted protein [Pelobates cultripes]
MDQQKPASTTKRKTHNRGYNLPVKRARPPHRELLSPALQDHRGRDIDHHIRAPPRSCRASADGNYIWAAEQTQRLHPLSKALTIYSLMVTLHHTHLQLDGRVLSPLLAPTPTRPQTRDDYTYHPGDQWGTLAPLPLLHHDKQLNYLYHPDTLA